MCEGDEVDAEIKSHRKGRGWQVRKMQQIGDVGG